MLSHWLFDPGHYAGELRRCPHTGDGPAPAAELEHLLGRAPYLHFLFVGDARRINPHPLFCAYAYKKLNGLPDDTPAFHHYATRGIFENARTSVIFDEEFYVGNNRDADCIFASPGHAVALHHFLNIGIKSGRVFSPHFDREFYLQKYPDVSPAIASGQVPSPEWHFVFVGLREQRSPSSHFDPKYYAYRYPHIEGQCKDLGLTSYLEHFLLLGKSRGYQPIEPLISTKPDINQAKAIFQRRARAAKTWIMDTRPSFPGKGAPAVSVVVPVFNQADFTGLFLKCAYFAAHLFHAETGKRVEIIVVNNGSTDDTDLLLRAVRGVRVLNYEKPMGFPAATNRGVSEATGDVVILANNDIEFDPAAFWQVYQLLAQEPETGVVGAVVSLPNGMLQEAGCIVGSAGDTAGLGRSDQPWEMFYSDRREVHYVSGCFIGFRRAEFSAVGGFDEAFSPGYYEEVDFCFRMAEMLGKRTVVEPAVQVVHYENATFASGEPSTVLVAGVLKNRERFKRLHRRRLEQHQPSTVAANQAGRLGAMRVLVIEDLLPDARLGSGFGRSAEILKQFDANRVAYDLLVINANPVVDEIANPRINVIRGWLPGCAPEALLRSAGHRYSHIWVCRTHNLARFVGELARLEREHGVRIICDTEALSCLRQLESRRLDGLEASRTLMLQGIRHELDQPVRIARWLAVTEYERGLIEESGSGPVSLVGHRIMLPTPAAPAPPDARSGLLLVGAVHDMSAPNYEGLYWFLQHVAPRIARQDVRVVGYWTEPARISIQKRFGDHPVEFLGPVDQPTLDELYRTSKLAIAPTRFAAGIPCKVVEAMSRDLPIVMTDLLALQILGEGAAAPDMLAVGRRMDDGVSFADWITRICTDEIVWRTVVECQRKIVRAMPGVSDFAERVDQLLRSERELIACNGTALSPTGVLRREVAPESELGDDRFEVAAQ